MHECNVCIEKHKCDIDFYCFLVNSYEFYPKLLSFITAFAVIKTLSGVDFKQSPTEIFSPVHFILFGSKMFACSLLLS